MHRSCCASDDIYTAPHILLLLFLDASSDDSEVANDDDVMDDFDAYLTTAVNRKSALDVRVHWSCNGGICRDACTCRLWIMDEATASNVGTISTLYCVGHH